MCIYRREGKGKWRKQIFFREKRKNFFEGGIGELDGPVFLHGGGRLSGADGVEAAFSGLLHRWEKVRKFASHSARKVRST